MSAGVPRFAGSQRLLRRIGKMPTEEGRSPGHRSAGSGGIVLQNRRFSVPRATEYLRGLHRPGTLPHSGFCDEPVGKKLRFGGKFGQSEATLRRETRSVSVGTPLAIFTWRRASKGLSSPVSDTERRRRSS